MRWVFPGWVRNTPLPRVCRAAAAVAVVLTLSVGREEEGRREGRKNPDHTETGI